MSPVDGTCTDNDDKSGGLSAHLRDQAQTPTWRKFAANKSLMGSLQKVSQTTI